MVVDSPDSSALWYSSTFNLHLANCDFFFFLVGFGCRKAPLSSCGPLLFFLCDRKMRMFCLLEYLFIVRKWKKRGKRPSSQTVLGKKKKRGKLPDFFLGFQLDRRGKWTCRTVTVCVLYLLERRNTWLNLFHLIPPPRSSFVCASFSLDPFCSTAVSSILPTHPLPI